MRTKTLLAALAAVALVVLPVGPATSQAGQARVRVAHLSPDTPGVDVYLDGKYVLGNVGYNTVSEYMTVPAGPHKVELRAAGSAPDSPAALTASPTLEAGRAYTAAGVGLRSGLKAGFFTDDLAAPPAGVAKVRVIEAAPELKAINVSFRGGPSVASNAAFPEATGYTNIAPGRYDIELREAGSSKVLATTSGVDVGPGIVYTLAAIGGAGQPLRVQPVVDARGASTAPTGGTATGAGGTAPAPSTPRGALLATAAVLVILAGGLLVRRRAVR